MPEHHRPMIAYIEKVKRKQMNKAQNEKLLALLGGKDVGEDAATPANNANQSSDESSDENDGDRDQSLNHGDQAHDEGSDAEMSDSESEQDVIEAGRGADLLQAPALDIPRVDDIPIVSRLANKTEQERLDEMDGA